MTPKEQNKELARFKEYIRNEADDEKIDKKRRQLVIKLQKTPPKKWEFEFMRRKVRIMFFELKLRGKLRKKSK